MQLEAAGSLRLPAGAGSIVQSSVCGTQVCVSGTQVCVSGY